MGEAAQSTYWAQEVAEGKASLSSGFISQALLFFLFVDFNAACPSLTECLLDFPEGC